MGFKTAVGSLSLIVVVIVVVTATSMALDLMGARETACFPVKSAPLDLDFVYKHKFYLHMISRYYLYRNVIGISKGIDPIDIIEGSVYYEACIRNQIRPGACLISGYNGEREVDYLNEPANDSDGGVAYRPIDGSNGFNGTFWFSLTDNSTFLLVSLCDGDNQMMWKLLSTTPTLPQFVLNKILERVVDLGFKEEYFTELRYDTCKNEPYGNGWSL